MLAQAKWLPYSTSGNEIEVRVSVPEVMIAKVIKGSLVEVRFDALPSKVFLATVTEVGISSIGLGTTFPVVVQLSKQDPAIRPGMAAEVTFRFDNASKQKRILIPAVAVSEDRDGRFVFVAKKTDKGEGIVKRRTVEVGELTSEGLEIENGLKEGEVVVTAGLRFLEDGQRVRLGR